MRLCRLAVCAAVATLVIAVGILRPAEAQALPNPISGIVDLGCSILGPLSGPCETAAKVVTAPVNFVVDHTIGPAVDAVTNAAGQGVLGMLSSWVGDGASWLVTKVAKGIDSASAVNLNAGWFRDHYAWMAQVAAIFLLPALLLAIWQGIVRQDGGLLIRTVLIALPGALLLTGLAVAVTQTLIAAVDAIAAQPAQDLAAQAGKLASTLSAVVGHAGAQAGPAGALAPLFVGFLIGLVMAFAAFAVWVELVLRAASVYLAVMFLPLFLVMAIWPPAQRWARRLVDVLIALVLSKLLIVGALSLGFSALASGDDVSAVLAGAALFLLAAFVPFAFLSLLPMLAEVAHPQRQARQGVVAATGGAMAWQMARARLQGAGGSARPGGGGGRPAFATGSLPGPAGAVARTGGGSVAQAAAAAPASGARSGPGLGPVMAGTAPSAGQFAAPSPGAAAPSGAPAPSAPRPGAPGGREPQAPAPGAPAMPADAPPSVHKPSRPPSGSPPRRTPPRTDPREDDDA